MPISQINTNSIANGAVVAADLAAGAALSNLGSSQLADANMAPGSVIQVVQTVKADAYSTTSPQGNNALIPGLSAALTPISTSSRIFVQVNFGILSSSTDSTYGISIFRNNVQIAQGDPAGNRMRTTIAGGYATGSAAWRGSSNSIMFVDSPSTTSACTYTFSYGGNGSAIVYLNMDGRNTDNVNDSERTISTVILMEIAA